MDPSNLLEKTLVDALNVTINGVQLFFQQNKNKNNYYNV